MTKQLIDFPVAVDSTMRAAYVACPQKFFLSHMLGLRRKGGSVHLVAGAAFAKGLEVARTLYHTEQADEETAILEGAKAALVEYGGFDPGERTPKTPERVAYAIADYFTEYPLADDYIQPHMTSSGPAVEFSFAFPTDVKHPRTGEPILYSGRFDMVGVYNSSLWVVDEKTTTRLGQSWIDSFGLRGQLLGYVYAAKQFGLPVAGFIIRGVSFLKDKYGYAEVIDPVPDFLLDNWYQQICRDIERMKESYAEQIWDYDFSESCNAYGGCPYKVLCTKRNPEQWVDMYFETHHWSPLDLNPEISEDKPILEQQIL